MMYTIPVALLFLASCGAGTEESNALNERLENKDDFDAAAVSFSNGEASTGEQYFFGVLADVVKVDAKVLEIDNLDDKDAELSVFNETLDSCLILIKDTRKALDLYKDKTWPKREKLHDLTIEWLSTVENIVNTYLRQLAPAMAVADEEWTDADFDLYDKYVAALEVYDEVDGRWVEFQFEFAKANDFELNETETIDMDALVEEGMKDK